MDFGDDAPPPSPGIAPAAGTVPDRAANNNMSLADSVNSFTNANGQYTRPLMDNANSMAGRVSGVQGDIMDLNRGVAQENLNFQNETFRPLQRGIVADAQGYDTAARRESAAAQSMADVGSRIDAETENNNRNLAARGVDPSSGASLALGRRSTILGGALKASAGNTARLQVEDTGVKRRMDANTIGNSLSGNAAQASSLAAGAGTAAVNTTAVPLQLQNQQIQGFTSLTNTGVNANNSAGAIMRPAGAGATGGGGSSSTNQALGSLAGAAASAYFGGGFAKGGRIGLADVRPTGKAPTRGMVNLDVGEYRIPAKRARELGSAALRALNEGRATVVMKRA